MADTPVPLERLLHHRDWVRRLAHALVRDPGAAEDLEQEAWRAAIEHGPGEGRSVRRWFRVVMSRASMNLQRGRDRRRARERAVARPEGTRPAADVVAEAEIHKRVVVAVMDLGEPYRTTILLRFFEDVPAAEIARRQGIPVETVRTRLKRAVAQLRDRLGGDGERRRGAVAWSGTGVLLMGAKTKVAVVAAVLVLAAGGGWVAMRPSPEATAPPAATVASVPARAPAPVPAAIVPVPEEGPRFAGLVVTRDGRPVPGARVAAAPDTSAEAVDPAAGGVPADAKGAFSLPVPAGAPFCDLLAEAPGFSPGILRSVRPGRDLRIVLDPEAALVGKVMDLEGTPVGGARVRWLGTAGSVRIEREGVSGADGNYRVAGIPGPGTFAFSRHWVEVTAAGFAPQFTGADLATTGKNGDRRLDVWLLRGAVLKGRVVDAEDGHPLGGARVVLWSSEGSSGYMLPDGGNASPPFWNRSLGETVADAQGAFRFEGVPAWGVRPAGINTPDPWTRWLGFVGAAAEGYAPMGIRVNVPRDGETVPMDIKCWPEATIEGRVVTSTGAPVPGVRVWLRDEERPSWWLPAWFSVPGRPTYETDADGKYRIGWISAPTRSSGRIEVMARGPGSDLGVPGPSQEVSVTGRSVTLVPDLVLDGGPAAPCIDVLVVDESDRPVAGALVFRSEWLGQRPEARTDAEGKARVTPRGRSYVEGKETTTVRLHITHPGFASAATEELTPSKVDPPSVRVVLHPGRRLAGRVLRPDGTPVAGAGVTVADGSLPAERLFSGDQGFGEGAWRVVSVAEPGSSGAVDLAWATTGPDGAFSFEDLPAGPWHVCAWKYRRVVPPERATAVRAKAASVPSDRTDLSITLDVPADTAPPPAEQSCTVEGTLRDAATGKPILKFSTEMTSQGKTAWSYAVAPGRFRFDSVVPGTWNLRIAAEGYDSLRREGIVVGPDGPVEPLDFVLDAGVVLRGVVRLPASDGAPALRLMFISGTRGAAQPSLDVRPDGAFEVQGLRKGATYRPVAFDRDAQTTRRMWILPGSREFTIPADGSQESVEWNFVPAGCLYARVASPRLLPGGSIEMATEDQKAAARDSVVEMSDAAGVVVARGDLAANNGCAAYLPPGNYTVRVTLPGGATQAKTAALEAGILRVEFDFP